MSGVSKTKQKVYDRYYEACQAQDRAEMGGDADEILAANNNWSIAWFDKYLMDTYGTTYVEPILSSDQEPKETVP